MARIIVGVMGDARGHLSQALALAEHASEHEYLFLGDGTVREVVDLGYSFMKVPMPATFYKNNQVDIAATVKNAARVVLGKNSSIQRIIAEIERFSPDLAVTAYEYFTPSIAKKLGIRCISIDNHHFLNRLRVDLPEGQRLSRLCYALPLEMMFSRADHYFISAFYQFPAIDPETTDVFLPILRKDLRDVRPGDGEHVLVYQTSPTFGKLIRELEKSAHRFIVYGRGEGRDKKNITFRKPSRIDFLKDLAACRYVICNGGHNLIAEALFLGKPVFSYPIHMAYEQFFNAHMLKELNYGDYSLQAPRISRLAAFEEKLAFYRLNIANGVFRGNEDLAARLQEFLGQSRARPKFEAHRI